MPTVRTPAPRAPVARTGARPATGGSPATPPAPPGGTGAPLPAAAQGAGSKGEQVKHRGIRWHRAPSGRIRWWNAEDRAWTLWTPGADAPPRPPGWEPAPSPLTVKSARASWRSPYRLVPLGLALGIVVIGVIQAASGSGGQSQAETKASAALLHKCLVTNGTVAGQPRYSATGVACSDPRASVRVVDVLAGNPGGPRCPAGTTPLSLPYPGVRYPHVECVVPIAGRP